MSVAPKSKMTIFNLHHELCLKTGCLVEIYATICRTAGPYQQIQLAIETKAQRRRANTFGAVQTLKKLHKSREITRERWEEKAEEESVRGGSAVPGVLAVVWGLLMWHLIHTVLQRKQD